MCSVGDAGHELGRRIIVIDQPTGGHFTWRWRPRGHWCAREGLRGRPTSEGQAGSRGRSGSWHPPPPQLIACACWCAGAPDDISALGLAYGDYTLMPLWIWLYCIVWWFIQDTFKVGWALFLEGGGGTG